MSTQQTITADQVRRLYDGRLATLDHHGQTLTHDDVINAWLDVPVGPGDTEADGTPADHMWQVIADAMNHWHAPTP